MSEVDSPGVSRNASPGPRSPANLPDGSGDPPGRECPYCHEPVKLHASICPHCRSYIDPRWPKEVTDEGVYRRARLNLLNDVKEEVFHWAHSRVTWVASAVGLLITLGVLASFQLTATRLIEQSLEGHLNREIGNITNILSNFEAYTNRNSSRLASIRQEIDAAVRVINTLNQQSAADSEARIDRISARMAMAAAPSLLLKYPDSLYGEEPRVLYRSPEEEIRFRWSSFAEEWRSGDARYRVQITPAGVGFGSALFERKTVFNSLKLSPAEIMGRLQPDGGRQGGQFLWRVIADQGSATERASEPGVFEYYPNAMARILATGEVRVGVTIEHSPPFVQDGPDGRELSGFDVELATNIAGLIPTIEQWDKTVRPEFRQFEWFPLLNALRNGDADVIISLISRRSERESFYELRFSDVYYTTFQSLLVTKANAAAVRAACLGEGDVIAGLARFSMTAHEGTTGEELAKHLVTDLARLSVRKSLNAVVNGLLNGDAMIAVMDEPLAREEASKSSSLEVISLKQIASKFPEHIPIRDDYCIAVGAKQEELLNAVDLCLGILDKRGVLEQLRNKYRLPE